MSSSNQPKIIFFGTSKFAREIFRGLLSAGYKVQALVAQPDKPVGRKKILTPPPTKELALEYKIPVLQPEDIKNNPVFLNQLKEFKPNLIIVAAYGKIIPKEILDLPKFGALNVHPSLLPKYRGPSPIQTAILNGDEETGVTIILMDEKIDHGPTIANSKFKIQNSKLTGGSLSEELAKLGANLLVEILPRWLAGKITPQEQDHAQATYTKILTREDGRLDFSKSATEIERQIRAFTPWPGSFTEFNNKRLKIIKARILNPLIGCAENAKIGQVFKTTEGEFSINCGRGSLILEIVQLEGKKEATGKEFLNGYPEIIGKVLK